MNERSVGNFVTGTEFRRRAEIIVAYLESQHPKRSNSELADEGERRFVMQEQEPEYRRLAEVLLGARRHAMVQDALDDDREMLHHGHLDHEALVSRAHHYEMLRHEACKYNHLLRGMIESSGQYFARDDLMAWLVAASRGRSQWAHAEVTGAVSEIALHAALQGLPELANLRYATVGEDLSGYDFVVGWKGGVLTIDAKTGLYAPLMERKRGHKHLEISVPREVVDGFFITRRGLELLRHEVRQALDETKAQPKPAKLRAAIA